MNGEDRLGNHHRQSRTVAIFRFHTFILSHLRTFPLARRAILHRCGIMKSSDFAVSLDYLSGSFPMRLLVVTFRAAAI